MKHVAQELGVSVTTVSNAYSYPERLSSQLRARILATAERMGYTGPDAAGRLLRSGKAKAVGVLGGAGYSFAFRDAYALTKFASLSEVLEQAGVALTLLPTGADEQNVEAMARAVVDCLVCFSGQSDTAPVQLARKRGLRIIHSQVVPDAEYVAIDDPYAGQLIGAHLAALGHRRVVVALREKCRTEMWALHDLTDLDAACDRLSTEQGAFWGHRLRGVVDGLGPEASISLVTFDRSAPAGHHDVLDELLNRDEPPTAIVALSDRLALSLMPVLERRGLRIGTDISLTGFDGIPEALDVGLTTLRQPISEKGRRIGELALDPDPVERQILLPVELIIGTTTGPAVPTGG
jgi:DNA-binding LacI/PurR family transcriptional regulator